MKRLIYAEDAMHRIQMETRFYSGTYAEIERAIDSAPTVDQRCLRPVEEWISVKDRLPDLDEKVIVYNAENDGTFFARRIESDFKCWDAVTRKFVNWRWIPYGYTSITLEFVTHWLPRPQPPKETRND